MRQALMHVAVLPRACAALACGLSLACVLAACGKPQPPPTDDPPEPQAGSRATARAHTELRDAIQRPIEKAEQVEADVLDAAERQKAAIDAQAGG